MLAGPERRFVKAFSLERGQDGVLRWLGCQNVVTLVTSPFRISGRAFAFLFGTPGWNKLQLEPIHDFLLRIALFRSPLNETTAKQLTGFIHIFWLAVDSNGKTCPPA
ncbi:hypothetical protein SAMN05216299_107129 [Nitrosospira sp. Nsp14]|nr:hypothetical protein SAMN05216299_107129 [Nitrosospira sp. Nsp14]